MRDICDLQEALDSIAEIKNSEISINAGFIREAAKEARAYLGYYRGAKQTVRQLKGSIKKLDAQLEATRRQLEQAKQQRDKACLKNKTIESANLFCGDFMLYAPPVLPGMTIFPVVYDEDTDMFTVDESEVEQIWYNQNGWFFTEKGHIGHVNHQRQMGDSIFLTREEAQIKCDLCNIGRG